MKRKPRNGLAALLGLAVVLCQNKAYSMESGTIQIDSTDLISVVLPVVEEKDPFSFFIDPLHIFYNTFGSSGGNITVEEDTCLLFYNRDESEYTLSSRSDSLEIINKSTVPIEVTITARLENADGICVMQSKDFEDRDSCDLYLALVDSAGNEQPLSEEGEVSVTVNLDRAPLDAYAYVLNEDTGEYQDAYQFGDIVFDTYSFGLMGACNGRGDWTGISGKPYVMISWNVEPVVSVEPDKKIRDISAISVSDGDVSGNDEQGADRQSADGDEDTADEASADMRDSVSEKGIADGKGTMKDSKADL